ncbi:MAG TPA: hydrolase, partial [Flavobacteriaceae bacterium]|nr:hydrolase [Flavobacteriaceae bacterium]
MKNKIFMYLFIFTLLVVLFQYVNTKNYVNANDGQLKSLKEKNIRMKDSLALLNNQLNDFIIFDFRYNQEAKDYYYNRNINTDSLITLIENELYDLTDVPGEHPLIPYAASEGKKMQFNSIKILNHKWIITDFSDGVFWGELLIKYEITPENQLNFKV